MALDYYYDQQLRRLLLQFTRVFAGFQFQIGKINGASTTSFRPVPVRIANRDRMSQQIRMNNSENVVNTVPVITTNIENVEMDAERRVSPDFSDKHQIVEREINAGTYTQETGDRFQLERYMAIPVKVSFNVDVWTSNMEQKFQLFEQIYTLFNPSLDLQTSTNQYDWCAIQILELDGITWTSAQVPIGTAVDYENLDITTFNLSTHTWISPPAKLTEQQIVHRVLTNIHDGIDNFSEDANIIVDEQDLLTRLICTPGNHRIFVEGNQIKLLGPTGEEKDGNGEIYSWKKLIDQYEQYRDSISQIRLSTDNNIEDLSTDVTGIFTFDNVNDNLINWTPDIGTLPANTLTAITGIIDPTQVSPGNGLPTVISNQRYLLTEDLAKTTVNWGTFTSNPVANDIIEYNGTEWVISFDSKNVTDNQYVINSTSNQQLKWTKLEDDQYYWILSIDGEYKKDSWRLAL